MFVGIALNVYSCCILGLYIALGVILIINGSKFNQNWLVSSAALNQVAEHWTVQPYVDAIVVNRAKTYAMAPDP